MNKNIVRDEKGRFTKQEDLLKIGDILDSFQYGKFEVIDKLHYIVDNSGLHEPDVGIKYFIIRFLETGYITCASCDNILKGSVKDVMLPKISGVGYLGADIPARSPQYDIFYRIWIKMIKRCYDPKDPEYNSYGAIGISVDIKWHSFINFYNDIKFLYNYDKKLLYPSVYHLDKDYIQFNIPKSKRIYSKDTCMFLSKFDNSQIRNKEIALELGNKYYGVKPNTSRDKSYITSYSTIITVFSLDGKAIRSVAVANFITDFAAASLYNYIYPFMTRNVPFHEINILNNINPIPYDELINYVSTKKSNDWFALYPTYESLLKDWTSNNTYPINRKEFDILIDNKR